MTGKKPKCISEERREEISKSIGEHIEKALEANKGALEYLGKPKEPASVLSSEEREEIKDRITAVRLDGVCINKEEIAMDDAISFTAQKVQEKCEAKHRAEMDALLKTKTEMAQEIGEKNNMIIRLEKEIAELKRRSV